MTERSIASEDYISLSGFKQFLIRVLRAFFGGLGLAGVALRRRYALVIAGVLCGGILGWLYPRVRGSYYQVSMIVEYRELDKTIYMNIVDEVNGLIKSGSSVQLANELGLSPGLAAQVISIETENLHGVRLARDTTTGNRMFRIVARLSAAAGADSLGRGLMNYINGIPYVHSEIGEQLQIKQERLVFIEREMGRLDSLKTEYTHSLAAPRPGLVYYNNAFDPVSIYKQSYLLNIERADVRQYLAQGDKALAEVTTFRAGSHPQSRSPWFYGVILTALGFFAAWGLAVILEIKKKIDVDQRTVGR